MTNEEAVRILEDRSNLFRKFQHIKEAESVEISDNELNCPAIFANQYRKVADACDLAIRALCNIPTGEPITLEQLREMGGQPYWHVGLQTESPDPHWKILDPFVARCPKDYGYGKRWLAYAYPSARIDREAWVSVGDRLPEPESGPYWVAKKKNNGEWQMKMALFCDYGYAMPVDAKTDVTWRDFDYTKIVNVTHWRTLPDLPDEP